MNIDYKAVFGLLSLLITTGMVGKLTSVPVEDSPQAVLAENRSRASCHRAGCEGW